MRHHRHRCTSRATCQNRQSQPGPNAHGAKHGPATAHPAHHVQPEPPLAPVDFEHRAQAGAHRELAATARPWAPGRVVPQDGEAHAAFARRFPDEPQPRRLQPAHDVADGSRPAGHALGPSPAHAPAVTPYAGSHGRRRRPAADAAGRGQPGRGRGPWWARRAVLSRPGFPEPHRAVG